NEEEKEKEKEIFSADFYFSFSFSEIGNRVRAHGTPPPGIGAGGVDVSIASRIASHRNVSGPGRHFLFLCFFGFVFGCVAALGADLVPPSWIDFAQLFPISLFLPTFLPTKRKAEKKENIGFLFQFSFLFPDNRVWCILAPPPVGGGGIRSESLVPPQYEPVSGVLERLGLKVEGADGSQSPG